MSNGTKLAIAAVVTLTTSASAGAAPVGRTLEPEPQPQLLHSFRDVFSFGFPSSYPPLNLQLFVRHTHDESPLDPVSLGDTIIWEPGDSGTVDFNSDNDINFDEFAERVTDGIDEVIGWGFISGEYDHFTPFPESLWFYPGPDLVGNQLDFFRLNIRSVEVPEGFSGVVVDAAYEFWGHPIPEPATGLLLAAGVALLSCRKR